MKKIYFLLSHTGTVLSNIIRFYTKNEYTHVSISLDENLDMLYSFGRLNPYNPVIGGFVHERINGGTYKRFKKTKSSLYSVEIEDEAYKKIKCKIETFERNKDLYGFNILGLFCVALHKKFDTEKSFYCAEFVKYLLDYGETNIKLPEIVKPEDFKKIENIELLYKGFLKDYKKSFVKNKNLEEILLENRRSRNVCC